MDRAIAAVVTLGVAVVFASVIYQTVKPGSQGPQVTGQVVGGVENVTGTLFKG